MPVYIENVISALSQQVYFPGGSRIIYQISSSGPLLHPQHLNRLGICVHTFLPPGQVMEVIDFITNSLKDAWKQISKLDDGKLDANTDRIGNPIHPAIAFSLSIEVASVVLSSLPFHSVSGPMLKDIQGVVGEALVATCIDEPLRSMLKTVRKRGPADSWVAQIVLSATLRLWYALNGTRRLAPHPCQLKVLTKLLDTSKDYGILPELSIELVCVTAPFF
jgi:hypothetical protein